MKEIPEILKPYEEYLRSTEKQGLEITFECGDTLPWESKCAGSCFFLIPKEDLKKRNFDNVGYGRQCC